MNKKELTPLKALEIIKNAGTIYVGCASNIYTRYSFECKEIETALKDYEILKADYISMRDFKYKQLDAIEIIKKLPEEEKQILLNNVYAHTKSEEEYNLLKEVLL